MGDSEGLPDEGAEYGGTLLARTNHDWSSTPPSMAIIQAIATAENTTPVALATDEETVLSEYVDPDALDTLITNHRENGLSLTVSIDGYTVQITGSRLVVTSPDGVKDE